MLRIFSKRLKKQLAITMAGMVLLTQFVVMSQACVLPQAAAPCHEQEESSLDPALLCQIQCASQTQVTDTVKVPLQRAQDGAVLMVSPAIRIVRIETGIARPTNFALSAAPPPLNLLYSRLLI